MPPIAWKTGTCPSSGEDIYYEIAGEGAEVVVLCHGLGGNHAVWFQQVPVIAQRFRVVTWDQRGFGRSSNRAAASGPDAAAEDLTVLLDHLEIERAHLVGQSMGGWAIVGFALRSRVRIRSLVLADTTGGIINETIAQVLSQTERRALPEGVLGSHRAIGAGLPTDKAFLYQEIGGFRGDIIEADMIATLFATRHAPEEVSSLATLPVLCVVGAEDDLIPPAAVKEVAAILDASFVEVPNAGHSPYFEQPEAWNAGVLDFLTTSARE